MKNTFNHLHLHTRYSLNDAMIKAKDLAKKCKEYGMKAVAVTEHGHMMNMPEAYLALKDEGIKLIVGMEAYVSVTDNKIKKDRGSHLVLLCENNTGYQNLMKIASDAAVNGYYYNPRTDKQKLRQYHEGLIACSACLGGSVNKFLLNGDYESAKQEALEYLDIFGEGNFFLEIQRHGIEEQEQINPLIIKLSKETGIPLVATNDSHYLSPEDWEAHDVQMAIQAKTTIHDTKRKVYTSHEFYFKSQEEMCKLFADLPEACENTVKIAERCNVEVDFKSSKLPPFKLPKGYKGTNYDLLREETLKGLEAIYGTLTQEAMDRMDFELGVVDRMGFVNYFLITWDVFRFCREGTYEVGDTPKPDWEPILTGPGRGSGAGSLMLYGLGITKIDPLKHDLLFQRFLNPDRISMPDYCIVPSYSNVCRRILLTLLLRGVGVA